MVRLRPGVYAAGDVLRWPNRLFDEEMRVEHWTNAAEQGAAAARNLLAASRGDEPEPYAPVPFFWSDQFDIRVQFLGRSSPDDEVHVAAGSVADGKFLALYRTGDTTARRARRQRATLGDEDAWLARRRCVLGRRARRRRIVRVTAPPAPLPPPAPPCRELAVLCDRIRRRATQSVRTHPILRGRTRGVFPISV